MRERTDEEIKAKLSELWPNVDFNEEAHGRRYCKLARAGDFIDITITQMYDAPGLSFAQLNSLAEFFDTMKVETEEEIRDGGCETCDYGSKYGFTLRVSPGDPFKSL